MVKFPHERIPTRIKTLQLAPSPMIIVHSFWFNLLTQLQLHLVINSPDWSFLFLGWVRADIYDQINESVGFGLNYSCFDRFVGNEQVWVRFFIIIILFFLLSGEKIILG